MTDEEIDLELDFKRLDWGLSLPGYKKGSYKLSERGDLVWVADQCHANGGYWYRMKSNNVDYMESHIVLRKIPEETIDEDPTNRPGWSDWS